MKGLALWLYRLLFLLVFVVLLLYYLAAYWVGKKALPAGQTGNSFFVAMVPPMSSEDLIRGRLVADAKQLTLYAKKPNGKGIANVWEYPIDQITGFSLGKVVGFRKGVIFAFEDGSSAKFALFWAEKRKAELKEALGWGEDASIN
ncbi:MAG: hypothetical protein ACOXZ4_02180 [Sphaerochaetaceae bacterium]